MIVLLSYTINTFQSLLHLYPFPICLAVSGGAHINNIMTWKEGGRGGKQEKNGGGEEKNIYVEVFFLALKVYNKFKSYVHL